MNEIKAILTLHSTIYTVRQDLSIHYTSLKAVCNVLKHFMNKLEAKAKRLIQDMRLADMLEIKQALEKCKISILPLTLICNIANTVHYSKIMNSLRGSICPCCFTYGRHYTWL